jgi:hypothetical protein
VTDWGRVRVENDLKMKNITMYYHVIFWNKYSSCCLVLNNNHNLTLISTMTCNDINSKRTAQRNILKLDNLTCRHFKVRQFEVSTLWRSAFWESTSKRGAHLPK